VFFLVLLGFLAGLGHWLLISAFLRGPASLIAPFTYVNMIWATAYGWLIFGQLPDGLSAVGMAIIVGERRRAGPARAPPGARGAPVPALIRAGSAPC
jgi:hypothetical protein